jgi:uncharacterized cupin superfamily protein
MASESKSHFLNPDAVRLTKSLGDATGLTQMGVHLVTLMPGRASGEYHRHWYEEECVYVLSGQGEAEIDDKKYTIGADDFLGFPKNGVAHGISNNGTEPLVCLVAGMRLEQDVCEYPRKNKRLYINGGREDLVNLTDIPSQGNPVPDRAN